MAHLVSVSCAGVRVAFAPANYNILVVWRPAIVPQLFVVVAFGGR